MRTTRTILFVSAIALMLTTGCSKKTYYQVYQTKPASGSTTEIKDGKYQHDEAQCIIRYNFFAEEGDAGFWFTNLTDSIVYVDLAETFFILNGNSNDYYQAREWTSTKSSTISITKKESKNKKKGSYDSSEGTSQTSTNASTFGERRIIMIPPHATKYFSEFHINTNDMMELCNVKDTPKRSKPEGNSFTEETTPFTFGNYITYQVGMKGAKKHVSDNFYISEIINVNGEAMFEMVRVKDACGRDKGERVRAFRFATPDRFYIIYKR